MYALINSKMYTGKDILVEHALVISKNIIRNICPTHTLPKNIKKYDLSGNILAPGFIDLHINGCGGVQFNDDIKNISIQTLNAMQHTNQKSGCTSFLPTLITCSDTLIKHAIEVMRVYLNQYKNQALGLHLEGPFLNPSKKGIHNELLMKLPTKDMIDYLCANNDVIKKITLAPERVNMEVIKKFHRSGICVSIGHSNATYQQTQLSFSFGVTCATHLFNAMPPIIAREPGIVGAVLDTPTVYCSIITDGIHVNWANIKYVKKIKGDKLFLITDGTNPAGSKNIDHFIFSGKNIYNNNNICTDENGVLSGSTLTMIKAIKNSVEYIKIPLEEALRMATLYPAKIIKIDNYLGSLEINKIANLTIFNTKYQIQKTIVNGKIFDIQE